MGGAPTAVFVVLATCCARAFTTLPELLAPVTHDPCARPYTWQQDEHSRQGATRRRAVLLRAPHPPCHLPPVVPRPARQGPRGRQDATGGVAEWSNGAGPPTA